MRRGDIWWADFPEPHASEPGFRRPVVIIQADVFTGSRLSTVVVVPITANLRLAGAPGNVKIQKSISGLDRDSVANVSQVTTVDKGELRDRVQALPRKIMWDIEDGIRLILGL